MSIFTEKELRYLHGERRLGRLATVGQDGMPHVAPVGWAYNTEHESIDIGGHSLERTKKYRDVMKTGRAAIVIDDVLPPWQPRGIESSRAGRRAGHSLAVDPHSSTADRVLGNRERCHR